MDTEDNSNKDLKMEDLKSKDAKDNGKEVDIEQNDQLKNSEEEVKKGDNLVEEEQQAEEELEQEDLESRLEREYGNIPMDKLVERTAKLLKNENLFKFSKDFNYIKTKFKELYEELEAEKLEEYVQGGGKKYDFHYKNPIKAEFNDLFYDYSKRIKEYRKKINQEQDTNLLKKREIIDGIKNLINSKDSISKVYHKFSELRNEWNSVGLVPRANIHNLNQNYWHNVRNFYDYLDLHKEFAKIEFEKNRNERIKIIDRAKDLLKSNNPLKASSSLNSLHKYWQEELGPTFKDDREKLWLEFKDVSNQVRNLKKDFLQNREQELDNNLIAKKEILEQIKNLTQKTPQNHNSWQKAIKDVNLLKNKFLEYGPVPRSENKENWSLFKETIKSFSNQKNSFYKESKSVIQDNLNKKKELIQKANDFKDTKDFENVLPQVIELQKEWKTIGRIPVKLSDSMWKEFNDACNQFFENFDKANNSLSDEEQEIVLQKETILKELKELKKDEVEKLKEMFAKFKEMEEISSLKSKIDADIFNHVISTLENNNLPCEDIKRLKYKSKLNDFVKANKIALVRKEKQNVQKKYSELQKEIQLLENNSSFFSPSKGNNSFLEAIKEKIDNLKSITQELEDKKKLIDNLLRKIEKEEKEKEIEKIKEQEKALESTEE